MALLPDLKMYGRFAMGLRRFLRETISLEQSRAIIQQRLEEREDNFLRLVERGIFGRRCTVFNIGGNKYRLIVKIEYKLQTIYIKHVLTHDEYNKEKWKHDC